MPDTLDPGALAELRDVAGGDGELYAELLDTFLTDADQYLGEMEAALAPGAETELGRAAHSLKSNAMSVGAGRLAELSRDLETEARSGPVESPAERVTAIRAELVGVKAAVQDTRDEARGGG